MRKDDLIRVMQISISLLDKGEADKAKGVLKIALSEIALLKKTLIEEFTS